MLLCKPITPWAFLPWTPGSPLMPKRCGGGRRITRISARCWISPAGCWGRSARGISILASRAAKTGGRPGVWYREWAPGAHSLSLIGDFNGWDRAADPLTRDEWGVWSAFFPDDAYAERLTHGSLLKVHVVSEQGGMDRIPAYARRVVQDPETHDFAAQLWLPPTPIASEHDHACFDAAACGFTRPMSAWRRKKGESGRLTSSRRTSCRASPRLGYNAIQLMAVMEHPYYGSFGYQCQQFFAVSSRFGTPEDLKRLIDTAHGLGLRVLLDLVHSHAVKNTQEGLNHFDGTDYQYFHAGAARPASGAGTR